MILDIMLQMSAQLDTEGVRAESMVHSIAAQKRDIAALHAKKNARLKTYIQGTLLYCKHQCLLCMPNMIYIIPPLQSSLSPALCLILDCLHLLHSASTHRASNRGPEAQEAHCEPVT